MDGLIRKLGPAWTFRIIGLVTLGTGLPAAWLVKERAPIRSNTFVDWYLQAYGGQNAGLSAYHPAIFFAGSMAAASAGLVVLVRLKLDTKIWKKL
jgi:hypothetical protein